MIVLGCIIGPLIETTINQWACIRLLKKLRVKPHVSVFVSAILFGLSHSYSFAYVALAFFTGLVFGSVFVIEDAGDGHPFLATLTVHILRNGITAGCTIFVL